MNPADVLITPTMTVFQVASLCQQHSKPGEEVYARIEHINGRPFAYLCRRSDAEFVPNILRRQA